MKNIPEIRPVDRTDASLDELLHSARWPDENCDPLDRVLRMAQWPEPVESPLSEVRRIDRRRRPMRNLAAVAAAAVFLAAVVIWTTRSPSEKSTVNNVSGTLRVPPENGTQPASGYPVPDTLREKRLNAALASLRGAALFEDDAMIDRTVARRVAEPDGDLEALVQPLIARRAEFEQRLLGRFYLFAGQREAAAVELLGCLGSDASLPLLLHERLKATTHAAAIRALLKLADVQTLAQLESQEQDIALREEIVAVVGRQEDRQIITCTPIIEIGDPSCRELQSESWPHSPLF